MSAGRFPQRIKRGSSVVTICKTPTKGYGRFTVVHYDSTGARCRRMFNNYAQALRAAKDTAKELAAGKPEVHTLTGHELMIYRRAIRALNGAGVDLDEAATQSAQATQMLGDVTVIEAGGGAFLLVTPDRAGWQRRRLQRRLRKRVPPAAFGRFGRRRLFR